MLIEAVNAVVVAMGGVQELVVNARVPEALVEFPIGLVISSLKVFLTVLFSLFPGLFAFGFLVE